MSSRRRINQILDPVLTVHTSATSVQRIVYILVSNRPVRYGRDYSRIVYIGTSGRGINRIASSASSRITQAVQKLRGVKRLDAYVVWSKSRKGRQTKKGTKLWHMLERALILKFCERYGTPPALNGTGQNMKRRQEFEIYREAGVDRIINRYN